MRPGSPPPARPRRIPSDCDGPRRATDAHGIPREFPRPEPRSHETSFPRNLVLPKPRSHGRLPPPEPPPHPEEGAAAALLVRSGDSPRACACRSEPARSAGRGRGARCGGAPRASLRVAPSAGPNDKRRSPWTPPPARSPPSTSPDSSPASSPTLRASDRRSVHPWAGGTTGRQRAATAAAAGSSADLLRLSAMRVSPSSNRRSSVRVLSSSLADAG